MQPGDYTIDVGLHEATGDLLKLLENVPQGTKVRLNVPRDALERGGRYPLTYCGLGPHVWIAILAVE